MQLTRKIIFSILNGLMLLGSILILTSNVKAIIIDNLPLITVVVPLLTVLIFAINIWSNWRAQNKIVSALQFIFTLLLIPLVKIVFAIAVPLATTITQTIIEQSPEAKGKTIDSSYIELLSSLPTYFSFVIFFILANILYQAYLNHKKS